MKKITSICFALFLFLSCKKEEETPTPTLSVWNSESSVLICNEGNFGWGNATISIYNKSTQKLTDSIYLKSNGYNLGDVCQSALIHNNYIYVVVNNSEKIDVLDFNFKVQHTIKGFNSPRYILPVNDEKAYVTDLYEDKIWIVNLKTNDISGAINCKGWTEEMVLLENTVWVTNLESKYLYLIDIETDKLDSIEVGSEVKSIQKDYNNNIWALKSGITPALLEITKEKKITTYKIPKNYSLNKLRYDAIHNSLYFINKNIARFNVSNKTLNNNFIAQNERLFYGLQIDPTNGDVYVSDVKNFIQNSTTYIYDKNGNKKHELETGIITNFFVFEN